MTTTKIISDLKNNKNLNNEEFMELISNDIYNEQLYSAADDVRKKIYDNYVYIRGLIEFTNHCKNNCYYCGIRCGNNHIKRYRLTEKDILECCSEGYELGFRTFVLQGGEDPYYTDIIICNIVSKIRSKYPDCAITLSIGEKSKKSYKAFFDAGANRYLLRHETANISHYNLLHPQNLSLYNRKKCLFELKDIGYQVGSGFMVGSPYQKLENLIEDLRFLKELDPDMIGIGPYLTHKQTPFHNFENGSLTLTLKMISILRLMFPHALIPSTTALGTIHPEGREMGIKAGANVVMPNLSPIKNRENYKLYENKICTDEESAQSVNLLKNKINSIGYQISYDIGNVKR